MNTAIINNPLTDKTVQSHFSKDSFLEMVNFWTDKKSTDSPLITTQSLGINSRTDEPETWTPIIWELDGNKDIAEQQSRLIVNMLANPNYTFEKSQGAGRPPTKNTIVGTRELHYANHFVNGNNHLHTLSFNYSKAPNGMINNQDNWARRSEAKGAFYKALNEELAKANLPQIGSFMLNLKQTNEKRVSETQKVNTENAVVEKQTYEEYKRNTEHLDQVDPLAVNDAYNKLKEEFDIAEKKQAERLQALQKLKEANEVALNYNLLVEESKKQKAIIEEKDKALLLAKEEKEQAIAMKENEIEEVKSLYISIQNDLEVEKDKLSSKLQSKEEEIKAISEELNNFIETSQIDLKAKDDAIENIKKVNQGLQSTNSNLTQLNNALQGNIDSQKQTIEMLQAQIEERNNNLKQQAEELKFIEEQRKLENEKLAEKVKAVIALEETNKTLRTENELLEKSVDRLQNSLNIGEKMIADLRKELAELKVWAESFVEKVKAKVKTPAVKKELDKAIENKPEVSEGLKSALGKLDEKSALNELLAMSKAGRDILKSTTDEPKKPTDEPNNPNKFKPK